MFIHWRIRKLPIKKKKILYKRYAFIWLAIVFGTILGGCSFLPKEEPVLAPPLSEPPELDYETAVVTRGELVKSVNGAGTFVSEKQHDLFYSNDGGRLEEVYVTRGDTVKKGQLLVKLQTGNLEFDISQVELDLKKAELRLKQMRESEHPDKVGIEIAKLDIQGIKNRLNLMYDQLAASKITSPIDGTVNFATDIQQGQYVGAYQVLVQIADIKNLHLQYTAISPADVVDVKIGMEATVEVNGEKTTGKVIQTPIDIPDDIFQQNPDHYGKTVVIGFDELPEAATVGSVNRMEIITAKEEDTLIIPKSTLRTSNGRNYVQVLKDNTKREVDIEVGIISGTEVEVLKGLEEGDVVIIK